MSSDKGHQQLPVLAGQEAVHEEAAENGVDDAEEVADHGAEQHEGHRRARALEALAGKFQGALGLAAGLKVGAGRDLEADAGKGRVKVLHGHLDLAPGGVVYVGVVALEAVQHDKVVEVPVDDAGQQDLVLERGNLAAVALGLKAVAAGGDQDILGARPVAGDAAVQAHLLQRHPLVVVGHHHGERGRAAFQRLHLHDDRDLGHAAAHRFFDCIRCHRRLPQLNRRSSTCVVL